MTNNNEVLPGDIINCEFDERFTGCVISNGDIATGRLEREGDKIFYEVVDKNNNLPYETEEVPYRLLDLKIEQFMGDWTEEEVNKYRRDR